MAPKNNSDSINAMILAMANHKENISQLTQAIKEYLDANLPMTTRPKIVHFPQNLHCKQISHPSHLPKLTKEAKGKENFQLMSIPKKDLIHTLIHKDQLDSSFTLTLLCTYKSYFTEKEMFTLLLEQFKVPVPINLSSSEKKAFLESMVSKIQIKVLIFIKDWLKHYTNAVREDLMLQEVFLEVLYLMASHQNTGKWVTLPLSQLITNVEKLKNEKQGQKYRQKCGLRVTSLPEIFIPMPIILDHAHFIAKQLCIFDIDNFKKLQVSEFHKKAWTKGDKTILAPNLTYIAEMSTKLSRFASYLVLMNKKNSVRAIMFEYLLGLCDKLIRLKNFNSAFSVYLGLVSQAVQRLKERIEPKLGKEYREMFCNLKKFFSPTNNMELLRIRQQEAMPPAVPYMGIYLSDIFYLEEMSDYVDKGKTEINWKKCDELTRKVNKILSYKEPYGFHKVDSIYNFIKGLPFISEEKIYQLSYDIMK